MVSVSSFPKGGGDKAKLPAGKPAAAAVPKPQTPMDVSKKTQNSQPLFKQPTVVDSNKVYLWNARGKRKNKKAPRELMPQIVVIDKIPIYIKKTHSCSGCCDWRQRLGQSPS